MDTPKGKVETDEIGEMREPAADRGPELTVRVILVGTVLGILVVAANIYMGLKIGFTEGYAILSAILCFAIVRAFGGHLTLLENNIGQTLASGAASMGIMVSVVPALIMLGYQIGTFQLMAWLLLVSIVGVLFAVPLRKQFVVMEALPFPTGTACATTIRAMHAKGEGALRQARLLGLSGLVSAVFTWFRDAVPSIIPGLWMFPFQIAGIPAGRLTLGLNWSPMLFGVGFLVGPRIGASLLLGGVLGSAILGPVLVSAQIIEGPGHSQITHWTMWFAIPLMVSAGFVALLLKGKTVVKAFQSMKAATASGKMSGEFPLRLWLAGIVIAGVATALMMDIVLQVPFWMGLVALVLSFLLAAIAVRAYGETDISPIGTMGHATQIIFGGLAPGQTLTNIMTAGITAGCANPAVDMMQDLKAGHLLGSTPRKQVYAQFIGVFVGSVVAVPIFNAVIGAYGLGTQALPAPAAILWSGMAKLLSQGLSVLPQYTSIAILAGIIFGVLLAILETRSWKKYVPSALGIGIGIVVPAFFTITIFVGSVIGALIARLFPKWSEDSLLPVASGGIAGEAILGVVIAALTVFGIL
jgi:putative OPT family oligopeptide transporter